MKKQTAFLILFFALFAACQKTSCSDAVKATIVDQTGLDGCGLVLQLSNEKYLEPTNLLDMKTDAKDGEKVWVSYHLAQSGGTVCMIGDIVVIDCISER